VFKKTLFFNDFKLISPAWSLKVQVQIFFELLSKNRNKNKNINCVSLMGGGYSFVKPVEKGVPHQHLVSFVHLQAVITA